MAANTNAGGHVATRPYFNILGRASGKAAYGYQKVYKI